MLCALLLVVSTAPALAQDVIWYREGSGFHDYFGWDVAILPSIDGDVHADVLVGAHAHDSGFQDAGQATLYSGSTGVQLFQVVGPDSFARVGISLSSAGLIDADAVPDFLIGADKQDTPNGLNSGRVCVYSGSTLSVVRCHDGEGPNEGFGGARGVKIIGDIDLDGRDDYLIGANAYTDFSPFYHIGKVYVYSGLTGACLRELMGENEGDFFGSTGTGMGDLNEDGVPDFLVHANLSLLHSAQEGRIYAYSGADFSLLWTLSGQGPGHGLGKTLNNVGDLNGDGVCDFIAVWRSAEIGHATIYSGADRSVIYTHAGNQLNDNFGQFGATSVGDVNRDGFPDYAVGALLRDSQGLRDNGAVFLYSGRTGALLYRFEGSYRDEMMGGSVAGGGDVDADGFPDIVVGSLLLRFNGPPDTGRATVFAGNDLYLQANRPTPMAGETLRINLRGGASNGLGLIALVEAAGLPVFLPLLVGVPDDTGILTHVVTVPAGFSGQEFVVQAWAVKHPAPGERQGLIADSSRATLEVQ
jgi:hypothetical protein